MENFEVVDSVETALNAVKSNQISNASKKRKRFIINRKLLPLKIHYFLLASASSSVLPFLPIFAKQLGISVAATRLLHIVAPLLGTFVKPLFGAIVDYLQILKQMLMLLLIIKTVCCLCIVFVPTPTDGDIQLVSIFYCDSDEWLTPTPGNLLRCTKELTENSTINCRVSCATCAMYKPNSNITDLLPEFLLLGNFKYNTTTIICSQKVESRTMDLSVLEDGAVFAIQNKSKPSCTKKLIYNCTMKCPCLHPKRQDENKYFSLQFWMFLILQLLLYLFTVAMNTLSDTACQQIIPDESNVYGQQRLWYTLGWTSFVLLTTYLLDLFNTGKGYDYSIGFYITVSLMFLDFVVVCGIDVDPVTPVDTLTEHLKSLLMCPRDVVYMIAVFYNGVISSVISSYLLRYLLDIKEPKRLMGYAISVSCISEVVGFYFSGKVIAKLGHFLTITIALLGYSIRYFIYYFIHGSWYVLLAELTQGMTFSLTLSSITTYSKAVARPGTEATTQGIMGGLYAALGWGVGNAIGTISNDKYGIPTTCQVTGTASLVGCILLLTVHVGLTYIENGRQKTIELSSPENPVYENDES